MHAPNREEVVEDEEPPFSLNYGEGILLRINLLSWKIQRTRRCRKDLMRKIRYTLEMMFLMKYKNFMYH